MKLLDVLTAPWAIVPEKLSEIQAIYLTHLRGEKIDIAGVEARLGRKLDNEPKPYEVVDGVAVISIDGVVAKRMNLFMRISGGTGTSIVRQQVARALDDPDVRAILLDIDSPGGTVDGTPELAQMVFGGREKKPIVAFTDGMMCSAAYWIGAAAHKVFISGDTVQVGSIGVVASHVDVSRAEDRAGIKTTEIVAGRFKRVASQYAPLTGEGWKTIQEQVDHVYSVFVGDVAKFRGVSEEIAEEKMADGRIFVGTHAIAAGLVDGVSTREEIISIATSGEMLALCSPSDDDRKRRGADGGAARIEMNISGSCLGNLDEAADKIAAQVSSIMKQAASDDPPARHRPAGNVATDEDVETKGESMKINVNGKSIEIEGDVLTLDAAFVSTHAPDIAAGFRAEGASGERERIKGVKEQFVPGHEALIEALMFDGKTSGPEAAAQILAAEKRVRAGRLADHREEAPPAVRHSEGRDRKPDEEDKTRPIEERCKKAWDETPALREEFSSYESYLAFRKAEENGQVRILRRKAE